MQENITIVNGKTVKTSSLVTELKEINTKLNKLYNEKQTAYDKKEYKLLDGIKSQIVSLKNDKTHCKKILDYVSNNNPTIKLGNLSAKSFTSIKKEKQIHTNKYVWDVTD